MVVFREDKSYEDEIKTWQLWHKRQHTAKQRIIEVDTKNSSGIIGLVEEVSHNAIHFCWNPNEPLGAKVKYNFNLFYFFKQIFLHTKKNLFLRLA